MEFCKHLMKRLKILWVNLPVIITVYKDKNLISLFTSRLLKKKLKGGFSQGSEGNCCIHNKSKQRRVIKKNGRTKKHMI